MTDNNSRLIGASAGVLAASLFLITFVAHSILVANFDPLNDYFSKLGSQEQRGALIWNIIGFAVVGILFAIFGFSVGRHVNDAFCGTCLICCGLGFSLGAIPADFINDKSPLTKAHIVSICISLAGWCFGLARTGGLKNVHSSIRNGANWAGVLTVIPLAGLGLNLLPAPIGHRILLLIVFGWTIFMCSILYKEPNANSAI